MWRFAPVCSARLKFTPVSKNPSAALRAGSVAGERDKPFPFKTSSPQFFQPVKSGTSTGVAVRGRRSVPGWVPGVRPTHVATSCGTNCGGARSRFPPLAAPKMGHPGACLDQRTAGPSASRLRRFAQDDKLRCVETWGIHGTAGPSTSVGMTDVGYASLLKPNSGARMGHRHVSSLSGLGALLPSRHSRVCVSTMAYGRGWLGIAM